MKRLLFPILAILLPACSKTSAPPPSEWTGAQTFLAHAGEMKEQPAGTPYHWMWIADGSDASELSKSFDTVTVLPVDLRPLGDRVNADDARQMAALFHDRTVQYLRDNKSLGMGTVDDSGPGTVVIESALLELKPTLAALNAVTSVAGFFIPGAALASSAISAGAGKAAGYAAKGSCAIGLRLRNGRSNEIILEVADKRDDDSAILFDMKSFSQYAHSRQSLDRWARNVAWLLDNKTPLEQPASMALVEIW